MLLNNGGEIIDGGRCSKVQKQRVTEDIIHSNDFHNCVRSGNFSEEIKVSTDLSDEDVLKEHGHSSGACSSRNSQALFSKGNQRRWCRSVKIYINGFSSNAMLQYLDNPT